MSRWRLAIILLLIAGPALVLAGLGSYFLWQSGQGWYVWWPMTACMVLGYLLALYWQRKRQLLAPIDFAAPMHWTERDREAWQLVEARAQALAGQAKAEFDDLGSYSKLAQEMALELAQFYRPGVADPIGGLTVPEVLAVVELAAHDLAELVDRHVPAGHLLSINDWRWTKQAADKATGWYRKASNAYWLAAAVLSPVQTGLRFVAARAGMSLPWQLFQQDLVAWFHTAFVHRLGTYLIDLYSGRLRVGAGRYRELKEQLAAAADGSRPAAAAAVKPVARVALTVMGQVKMGKSSFINALLGTQRAQTDVLPMTDQVTRYELPLKGTDNRLVLFDTVGYGHSGPREDQIKATLEAARKSDVVVLVLHARDPARQGDQEMLRKLTESFASRPELRLPPILAVMTHIDLLSPALEWAPPYNWQGPQRPKERQIQQALTAVREQLGDALVGAVPVCTAAGKVYGIDEWFLPTLAGLLGEARAVAMLRCLQAETDAAKVRKVVQQVLTIGGQVLEIWAQSREQARPSAPSGRG